MKRIISVAFAFLLSINLFSQEYDLEGGLRSGISSGVSLRVLTGPDTYTEAMMLTRNHGVQFALLLGSTNNVLQLPIQGFSLSKAWGGHIGLTGTKIHADEDYYNPRYRRVPVIGVDYYIGLNYSLNRLPLTFSIDFKPFAEILPERFLRINLWDFGFGIRYRFSTKI